MSVSEFEKFAPFSEESGIRACKGGRNVSKEPKARRNVGGFKIALGFTSFCK